MCINLPYNAVKHFVIRQQCRKKVSIPISLIDMRKKIVIIYKLLL